MDEYVSIFVESNENMGLLHSSYLPLIEECEDFLDTVETAIEDLNRRPSKVDIDLSEDISAFKKSLDKEMTPEAIDINTIGKTQRMLKKTRIRLDDLLNRYIKDKNRIAYGGNYYRAILRKPKVYSKEMDPEVYERINNNIRTVYRAMDWLEKGLIDLYNLNDQDMNILNIVNRVYAKKKIYESGEEYDVFEESKKRRRRRDTRSGPEWDRECRSFQQCFDVDLNTLGDIRSPAEKIGITVGGRVKMTFKSGIGHIPGKPDKKLHVYAQVPTAIHSFNVNKSRITTDRIGIDKAIEHYVKLRDNSFQYGTPIEKIVKKYDIKPRRILFNLEGNIGLTFSSNLPDQDGKFAIIIGTNMKCRDGSEKLLYTEATKEEIKEVEHDKPQSDNKLRDTFQNIDAATTAAQQKAKKAIQQAQQVGRAAMKPVNRTKQWLTKMTMEWKDKSETEMKEKMADPHARKGLYGAIRKAIHIGALAKAGLLLNPIFMGLTIYNKASKKSNEFRIRNEMIGEIKAEIDIIEDKIKLADQKEDYKQKYQMMRLRNEMKKKLLRVGGTPEFKKII